MDDITSILLQQLSSSCINCELNDLIDMQLIDCDGESVIVYRARLEGTSQTDSGYLISLIEEWVRTGPSLIVTGILMEVDPKCAVAISSLSNGDCVKIFTSSSPTGNATDTTASSVTSDSTSNSTISDTTPSSASKTSSDIAAIIGGVVAIIIIIGIVIVIVFALRVKAHLTNGGVTVKNFED